MKVSIKKINVEHMKTIRLLFFLWLITLPLNLISQVKNLYFLDTDSIPCGYASIQLYPGNLILIADDKGKISIDSSTLVTLDSLIFQHLSYNSFSIKINQIDLNNDIINFIVKQKVYVIEDVKVANKNKKIYQKALTKFEDHKPDSLSVCYGFFGYFETNNDKLIYSLLSDVFILYGGSNKSYFKNYGFENNIKHIALSHMGSVFYIDSIYTRSNSSKIFENSIKCDELFYAEKFSFDCGPLSRKYSHYYYYILDSVSLDSLQKYFYYSFESKKSAPANKVLTGSGKILINGMHIPEEVVFINPNYPIRYPSIIQHYLKSQLKVINIDTVRYSILSDKIVPTYISHTLILPDNRKIYTYLIVSGCCPSAIAFNHTELEIMKAFNILSPLDKPIIFPGTNTSAKLKHEQIKNQLKYNITYTSPNGMCILFDPNSTSFSAWPNGKNLVEKIIKFRNELWKEFSRTLN